MALLLATAPAAALAAVIDFEALAEGTIVDDSAFPAGFAMTVISTLLERPHAAVIFDSSCPGGCSGRDPDLQTPGYGPGNTIAQGRVMIIAQDVIDARPADGLVDDPDDDSTGGSIRFFFAEPVAIASLVVIDVDSDEKSGFVQLALAEGGFVTKLLEPLGDNSVQTIEFEGAPAASSLRIFLEGSGAIDDITFEPLAPTLPPASSTSIPASTSTTVSGVTTSTVSGGTTSTVSGATTTTVSTTTTLPGSTTSLPASTTTLPGATSTTIVVATTVTTVTTTMPGGGLCGDVNGDGRVTASDAQRVLSSALDALAVCPASACDVDASGSIDATDALATLRIAVGLGGDSACTGATGHRRRPR